MLQVKATDSKNSHINSHSRRNNTSSAASLSYSDLNASHIRNIFSVFRN